MVEIFVAESGIEFRWASIPDGYIAGADRARPSRRVSHLYKGDFGNVGAPMCPNGWNRDDGESFSIWRNNVINGVCLNCLRRANKGLEGVPTKSGATLESIQKAVEQEANTTTVDLVTDDEWEALKKVYIGDTVDGGSIDSNDSNVDSST